MYYVEGTAGIMLPCFGEIPVNIKMHYLQEIIGNMM